MRFFDLLFSTIALLVLLPALIPVAILLKLTGEGKVLYFQSRIGKDGKEFKIWKFATMLENSPNMKNAYITTTDDPRVLSSGKFLRKYKINELPQVINILKGDMSIVGPRPLVAQHLEYYSKEKLSDILSLKPGLTGVASIIFRDEERMISNRPSNMEAKDFYKIHISPYKEDIEQWYKENRSMGLYFKVIFLTAWCILAPDSLLHEQLLHGLPAKPNALNIEAQQ